MGVFAGSLADATDVALVCAVRDGDDRAFEELYRRYSRRIAGYVYRMVADHDRAEDITQEAFVSALRRLRQTDSDIAFKPWIFEIAKNAAIDQFRRTSRAEEVSIDPDHGALRPGDQLRLIGGDPAPDAAVVSKERLEHLRGAFDELSESHLRIIVMRELEGLSYREIGERMELTRPAVESTLFRARRRLNQEYAELERGARCIAMGAAIERLADGDESARDRRRLARHVRRCASCRRDAREHGVAIEPLPALHVRVAALAPVPLLLRRRRGSVGDSAAQAPAGYAANAQHAASTWAPTLATAGADGATAGWGKAAALVATLAVAGGGAATQSERIGGERIQTAGAVTADRSPAEARGGAGAGAGSRDGQRPRAFVLIPHGSPRATELPAAPGGAPGRRDLSPRETGDGTRSDSGGGRAGSGDGRSGGAPGGNADGPNAGGDSPGIVPGDLTGSGGDSSTGGSLGGGGDTPDGTTRLPLEPDPDAPAREVPRADVQTPSPDAPGASVPAPPAPISPSVPDAPPVDAAAGVDALAAG